MQVEQQQVDLFVVRDDRERFLSLGGFEDLRVGVDLPEHEAQTLAEQRVVVTDEDLHGGPECVRL